MHRLRDGLGRASGRLRITTFKYAAVTVLATKLPSFMAAYPAISMEVSVDATPIDIVASGFSAGIRFGDDVDGDMVAVRVGPDVQTVVVVAPSYQCLRGAPVSPGDLSQHECIGLRLPGTGGLHPWAFQQDGVIVRHHVDARLAVDDSDLVTLAALAGQGVAYRLEDQVADHIASGRLIRVLDRWSTTTVGLHIYYPSRLERQPALQALIAHLRYRTPSVSDPIASKAKRAAVR